MKRLRVNGAEYEYHTASSNQGSVVVTASDKVITALRVAASGMMNHQEELHIVFLDRDVDISVKDISEIDAHYFDYVPSGIEIRGGIVETQKAPATC